MAPKNHPCFSAPAEDCCCDFAPRREPLPYVSDFVCATNHQRLSINSKAMQKTIPLYTERRQRYEAIKFLRNNDTGTQTGGTVEEEKSHVGLSDLQLLNVKAFREENMRDCMSTMNQHLYKRIKMISGPSTHRCRHKFRVDERNRLVPAHVTDSGQSTCDECGQASDYLEDYKGGYPWKKGDLFSNKMSIPEIIILQESSRDEPFANHHKEQKGKRQQPVTKNIANLNVRRNLGIASSSALVYQNVE